MGSLDTVRKPPHSKTFGLELECYPNTTVKWYSHMRFWYVSEDGSLRYGGVEFICQPMPYKMLIKQLNWLHKKIGNWKVDNRCGLHIHVSRQYWSNTREHHFTEFLRTLSKEQLITLFGRVSEYADVWGYITNKYRAVNCCHAATYEFRLWAAGDLSWTIEALRRTKLIVEYRGKWSYDQCLELFTKPE